MLTGWWREAGREECGEGGKTTGSSSAVINLGSDTGLRGLASTAPHNWVTHRGRPTQAIMWWSVGGGPGEVGEGGSHTYRHLIIRTKTTQPSFTLRGMTEVQTVKKKGPWRDRAPTLNLCDVATTAKCVYMPKFQQPLQHDNTHRWRTAAVSLNYFISCNKQEAENSWGPTLICQSDKHPSNQ